MTLRDLLRKPSAIVLALAGLVALGVAGSLFFGRGVPGAMPMAIVLLLIGLGVIGLAVLVLRRSSFGVITYSMIAAAGVVITIVIGRDGTFEDVAPCLMFTALPVIGLLSTLRTKKQ